MDILLYGIPNCNSVKKARDWLTAANVSYQFHDFKKAGISAELVDGWLQYVPWETLLNRQGTTWRKLPEAERLAVTDAASAKAVMLANPSCVKRPVVETRQGATVVAVHTGFNEAHYAAHFAAS